MKDLILTVGNDLEAAHRLLALATNETAVRITPRDIPAGLMGRDAIVVYVAEPEPAFTPLDLPYIEPKRRLGPHAGRDGAMPILSGKRKKFKKYKRHAR